MANNKKYWNSLEQLEGNATFVETSQNEFTEKLPIEALLDSQDTDPTITNRRDFLKFMGFSVAAATLAACETPVVKSIPYVVKPEEITPGVANYYASTYYDGTEYAPILVKTREARPIYISGNKLSKQTKGAISARVNSSVLSLYDSGRLNGPKAGESEISWAELDLKLRNRITEIKSNGGNVRLLSNSIISPSTLKAIEFLGKNIQAEGSSASFVHTMYDAVSYSGMIKANEADFGVSAIPTYKFDRAKTIVSLGADFLSTWLNGAQHAALYATNRNPDNNWMSRHFQFESNLSLSGSNADVRGAIRSSDYGAVAIALYNDLAKKAGIATVGSRDFEDDNNVAVKIQQAADELWASKSSSLVIAGSNDKNIQHIVNAINNLLGAYGNTIDLANPSTLRKGNDEAVAKLVNEMSSGKVDLLIIYGANPVYTLGGDLNFEEALVKVKTKVSFADREDETASLCDYIAPDSHYLESWNDFNPGNGQYSLAQPTINTLYNTRQAQTSILKWAGYDKDYLAFMKANWEQMNLHTASFEEFWLQSLHDGVLNTSKTSIEINYNGDVAVAAKKLTSVQANSGLEVEFYQKTSLGEGNQANNPWLHEFADPVTRVTWDNYITMNPADMKGKYNTLLAQESPADMAKVTINNKTIELPVVAQPGQKKGTIGIALGYGRTKAGKVANNVGKNVYPMLSIENGTFSFISTDVTMEPTGEKYAIACIQTHHTMMARKIVNETTVDTYKSGNKEAWNPDMKIANAYGEKTSVSKLDLWESHSIKAGHRWGLSIDLNSCIGCGACITSCHSENNVPVVGKDEIRRTRSMSWLRIDRYFSSDADPKLHVHGQDKNYDAMEVPAEYPQTVFMPVMCQHCNHAPCETVCPVAATTHSNEGLNQMTYNRCVGTRYCANNCPYKVRRFNWFNYIGYAKFKDVNPAQDDIARMVLNPDVNVRSRGVMEKCSMCVQRIQAGKLIAKKASRKVQESDIVTACAEACPTNAIKFGDLNDDKTLVAKESSTERAYNLLEEVGTQPNVYYLTKVRNEKESLA
jgi:MoCo/4Fe-4S cofactor protein with predicted Tat translocation signal